MSIKLPSSGGGASASDVWSYSTRTLTQTTVVIERANGYSANGVKAYDVTRFYNATMQLLGSGYGVIAEFPSEDLAPSLTFSQINTPSGGSSGYSFPTTLIDHDDSTYISWNSGDAFLIDLGSLTNVFLRIYHKENATPSTFTVYGSNDKTNWSVLASPSTSTAIHEDVVFNNTYRYLKFNATTTENYYSIEVYQSSALPISRTLSNYNGGLKVFARGYYQLLEVVKV